MASPLDTVPETVDVVTTQALAWPDRARALVIDSPERYAQGAETLKAVKALRAEVDATFDPMIAAAFRSHRTACEQKKKAEAPLSEAERIIKTALVAYDVEQERLRREEQRRLEMIAQQEEETRQLELAAAMEREGHEYGDDAMVAEAHAIIEQPIAAPPVAAVAKATPKVSGITYRTTYSARVDNLPALIRYVAAHPEHANLLVPNQTALNSLARGLKTGMKIPGVQVIETRDVAAGSR